MNEREIYETEVEILSKVKKRFESEGRYITKTQLQYLYKTIVRYISEKAEDTETLGIVLPYLGTLYAPESSILTRMRQLQRNGRPDKVEDLQQKINALYEQVPDELSNTSDHFKTRLRKTKRFTGGLPIIETIRKQNNDYQEI